LSRFIGDLLEQGNIRPIVVALGRLAPGQVVEPEEGHLFPAVVSILPPGPQLVERRQQMVAPPELQQLFASVRQSPHDEPAK
jgi:hypothetical protein